MKVNQISRTEFFRRFSRVDVGWCIYKWTLPPDLEVLFSILQSMDARLVVEIGTGWGHVAACMSKATHEDCKVLTVGVTSDLGGSGMPDQKAQAPDRKGPRAIGQFIDHYGTGYKVTMVIADSRQFDFSPYKGADLVFIDGGHDRDTVLSDLQSAHAIVRKGGYVVFHDFMKPSCGVDAAVADFDAPSETAYGVSGTITGYFRKE